MCIARGEKVEGGNAECVDFVRWPMVRSLIRRPKEMQNFGKILENLIRKILETVKKNLGDFNVENLRL